jgi:hypothetical protein
MSIFAAEAPATSTETVTEESPKRLTHEQAKALFLLIETFRPDWVTDWKAVMGKLQQVTLSMDMEGHEVVAYVIKSAATKPDTKFEDLDFNQTPA